MLFTRIILLLTTILFLFPIIVHSENSETITLVADEWPPFNSVPGSSEEGFLVDVARAVFEKKGIDVSYRILPWKRAIELTRNGHYMALSVPLKPVRRILYFRRKNCHATSFHFTY